MVPGDAFEVKAYSLAAIQIYDSGAGASGEGCSVVVQPSISDQRGHLPGSYALAAVDAVEDSLLIVTVVQVALSRVTDDTDP